MCKENIDKKPQTHHWVVHNKVSYATFDKEVNLVFRDQDNAQQQRSVMNTSEPQIPG
jgi:hypothetical protein